MELKELYERYKVAKVKSDQAAKEEEKLKKALKEEMLKAGEDAHEYEDGYLVERYVQNRKSMDEKGLLDDLKEKGITAGIKTVEAVDEDGLTEAIKAGDYSADDLKKFYSSKEVVVLKLSSPEQRAKAAAKAVKK